MTPDNELPVWPFMPNWREPITERLSWATVVLGSDSGAEQRYSSRLSPRREFEAMFHPIREVRTFFDLFISTLGGQEMMIPLWHDRHKLTAAIEDGDARIDCDTEFGEFMDGGMAMLVGADPWSHKVVGIDTVDDNGFTLVDPVDFDWPSGAVVHPLRRSRIDLEPNMNLITDSVGEITLRFILNQANDLPDLGEWDGVTLEGAPVLTISSNFSQPVEFSYSRIMETEDNGVGLTFIRDIAERAFRAKSHTWLLNGRQQNWEFRQFLYRMAGRRSPIWIPTGASDMRVAVQADAAAGSVQVRKVGLTYVGGPQPGRDRFLALTADGYQARRITGLGVPTLDSFERINLNANLTYALPVGTELSFLEIMRADGDDIELLHHADTEGATECSINFRGFSDTRNPAGSIIVPLPSDVEQLTGCGEPAEGENPCLPPPFEGWAWEWIWITQGLVEPVPGIGTVLSILNTPNPWSLVSNGGAVDPVNGPKFSFTEEVVGVYYRQIMRMVAPPVPGTYEVIMDPNNFYPASRYSITGRSYDSNMAIEYWTNGAFVSGGSAKSGTFDL